MELLDKAKVLADYTKSLAAGPDWGVDDQDMLEWLIARAEKTEKLKTALVTVTRELEQWNLTEGDPEAVEAIRVGNEALADT